MFCRWVGSWWVNGQWSLHLIKPTLKALIQKKQKTKKQKTDNRTFWQTIFFFFFFHKKGVKSWKDYHWFPTVQCLIKGFSAFKGLIEILRAVDYSCISVKMVLEQLPPNPKTNPDLNPKLSRGSIFLGVNCLVAPQP